MKQAPNATRRRLEACRLRLRPIVMTSLAFILGVVPLVISEGAGAEMRRTLGTAVFAGMLGVTLFGVFLTPVFYYVIQWFSDWRERLSEQPFMEAGPATRGAVRSVSIADGQAGKPSPTAGQLRAEIRQ